jgi:hypothetical protein
MKMTCGCKWHGIGFDVIGDKLTLDKFGHIFSVHTLYAATIEDLELIRVNYNASDVTRTVKVIELANELENEIDA